MTDQSKTSSLAAGFEASLKRARSSDDAVLRTTMERALPKARHIYAVIAECGEVAARTLGQEVNIQTSVVSVDTQEAALLFTLTIECCGNLLPLAFSVSTTDAALNGEVFDDFDENKLLGKLQGEMIRFFSSVPRTISAAKIMSRSS